jgi:lauroyl/myristoyl acyltransferase
MLAAIAYSTADTLVRLLPEPWIDVAARALGRVAYWADVPARRVLETNLARIEALGPRPLRSRAKRTFEQFALVVTDFLRLGHLTHHELATRIELHGARHLEAARRSGRPCVIVSLHAGCWELGVAYLAAQGVPVRVLAQPHANAAVERFFRRRRAAWGIHPLDGSPLWRAATQALRAGEWVAVMGDRAAAGEHGDLDAWAIAIAKRTGALVLPMGMTRLRGGRHAVWCEPAIDDPARLGEVLHAALRRHLARARGQWFAFAPAPEGLG